MGTRSMVTGISIQVPIIISEQLFQEVDSPVRF